ncbi:hypothetical protein MACJ_003427 [Theileria orientalis]|uniref:Uncharacterized protein n=1 Tax=Theileria orientalis TaxID=68886 RepID=A0A976XJ65_THEOR|nr:hypothetical protein MACJ_003427 [Theileria orientalis]
MGCPFQLFLLFYFLLCSICIQIWLSNFISIRDLRHICFIVSNYFYFSNLNSNPKGHFFF